jgi:hypothetical protein
MGSVVWEGQGRPEEETLLYIHDQVLSEGPSIREWASQREVMGGMYGIAGGPVRIHPGEGLTS